MIHSSLLLSGRGRRITAAALACCLWFVFRADGAPPAVEIEDAVNAKLGLTASSIQTVVISETDGVLTTTVMVEDESWTLELTGHSMRSDRFQLLVQEDPSGPLVPVEPPPPRTYKGIVLERPDAQVRASYVDGRLTGMIFSDLGTYGLEPLVGRVPGAADDEYVIYLESDAVNTHGRLCGVTDETPHGEFEDLGEGGVSGTGLKVADVAIDTDFEFYTANGSNVNNTLADIEGVMNSVEAIYEVAAIGITYEITTVVVRTAVGDPYASTDSDTFLCELRNQWISGPETAIVRDAAHLFSGKVLGGGILGIAYLGVMCNVTGFDCGSNNNLAFGLSASRNNGLSATERAGLTAHEIGHNWNAGHCNGCGSCTNCCRIMCSGLGGCTGILTSFGCVSEGQIVAFKNSRSCLSDLLDPQAIPFFDNFESGIQAAKWSYNDGSQTNANGVGEPSASLSLNLDSISSSLYQDDEIRSNFILLGGQSTGSLTYFVQHIGPESGEQLFVEGWGTNNLWNLLNTITSDGVNQGTYTSFAHSLAANLRHNEFRVRFRTDGTETNDDWYVDDVSVTANSPPFVTLPPVSLIVCQNEPAAFTVSAGGTAPLSYQWKKGGANISGATSPTYNIASAAVADAANYTCLVTNAFGSDESDPASLTVVTQASCSDGAFCNGPEQCLAGACIDAADPCAEACKESTDTCQPFGVMTCELLSTGAVAGGSATLDLFLEQVLNLRGYQATISITQTSGTGTVSVGCPDGVEIDAGRSDYVFLGAQSVQATDCTTPRLSAARFSGGTEVPLSPKRYLGTFHLDVSPNATLGSTFEISFVLGGPEFFLTYLRDASDQPIPFDFGPPCELTITECANYGDVDQPLNGVVDLDDILCVIEGFGNQALCPLGDLAPCFGNGVIDLEDILAVLDAFAGNDPCCGG